jgi:hypothetical protein
MPRVTVVEVEHREVAFEQVAEHGALGEVGGVIPRDYTNKCSPDSMPGWSQGARRLVALTRPGAYVRDVAGPFDYLGAIRARRV